MATLGRCLPHQRRLGSEIGPGGRPNLNVTVALHGRRLIVSGVRRDSFLEEGSSHYLMEISYNRFERSLMLPANLQNARVTIAAREGLLLVRMIMEGNENV